MRKATKRPTAFEAVKAFAPVYGLLQQLRTGEVDSVQGRAFMRAWDGDLYDAAVAIEGCAQRLLGHSKEQMTKAVYRRIGEKVRPTK